MANKRGLTKNQQIFCDEYLIDRNGTRAYRAAYKGCKSDNTAGVESHRLLKNPKIKTIIDKKTAQLSKKAGITTERIYREERRLAFSDLRQIFDGETTIPPSDLPDDIALAIAGIEVNERVIVGNDDEEVIQRTYKYKLWDKGAALKRLENMFGMNAAKEVNVNVLEKVVELMNKGNARLEDAE